VKPIVIEIGRLVPPSVPHQEDVHRVDELKDSLRELGLRVPLVVRPTALGLEIVDVLGRARDLGHPVDPGWRRADRLRGRHDHLRDHNLT
jgi:hypothetical protein